MSDKKMVQNFNKLKSRIKVNNLTFELFLNDKVFQQDNSQSGIYICTYKKDPRYVYIGKTNDFARRWKEHERDLLLNVHCGNFQEFYIKNNCTLEEFEWGILDYLENDDTKLRLKERQRIVEYDNDNYHILLNSIKYKREENK